MATTLEALTRLREKANRNNIHDNIDVDKQRAVQLLNESQYKYTRWILDTKNTEDVRRIQFLLKPEKLKSAGKTDNSDYFTLPKDIFDISQLEVIATEGSCSSKILAWEAKTQNIPELLVDKNNKPSFYYEDTFYNLEDGKVRVYKDNFTIKSVVAVYYRYPKKIDIEGYINVDGKNSSNSNPEWDEFSLNKIIDIAVKDFNINSENLNRLNPDNSRIVNNF